MSQKPFVLEFVSLPGSGKSTLSHRVAQMLRKTGVAVKEPTYALTHMTSPWIRLLKKGIHVGWAVLCMPRCVSSLTRAVVSSRPESAIAMLANLLFVVALVRKRRCTPGIVILDQGVFQAVWSIGFRSDEQAVTRCVAALVECDLIPRTVVVIDAPVPTVRNRLSQRPGIASVLEKRGIDEVSWQKAACIFERVKKMLYDLTVRGKRMYMIRLNNSHDDVEPNARRVANEIGAIL